MPEILYADAAVAVVVKPAGVLSQGDAEDAMPVLLQKRLGGAIFPVHRLDQPTGGVMVYARTQDAAAKLSAQMQSEAFGKEYLAVLDLGVAFFQVYAALADRFYLRTCQDDARLVFFFYKIIMKCFFV